MIVRLIKRTKIYNFKVPETITGNYYITDIDGLGNSRNLVNVEENDGVFYLKSTFDTKIVVNNKEIDSVVLKEHSLYFIKINSENNFILLYCSPNEENFTRLKVEDGTKILIGNSNDASINYNYPLISSKHALLTYSNSNWYIEDLNSNYGTYVNNEPVKTKILYHGDVIFIMGLKIIVLGDSIIINNVNNLVKIDNRLFTAKRVPIQPIINDDSTIEEDIDFYKDEDYFFRSPRFKAGIEPVEITIDPPPGKQEIDDTPILYVVGPMLSMGMVSLMMGFTSIQGVMNGTATLASSMPGIIMCVAMLLSMILWPLLNRNFQNKKREKFEKLRQEKYIEYIAQKRTTINNEMENQKKVLVENYIPLDECANIILGRKRNLWEREIDQNDFLDLRLGVGNTSFKGTVKYPEERFSLDDDNLRQLVLDLGKESKELENVPVNLSFVKNNISAIIGDGKQKNSFIDGLMLQLMAFHSYEDLKIVVFTNEKNASRWGYLKSLPHCWNNSRTVRYFSTNTDEAKELSLNLEQVLQARKANKSELAVANEKDYASYQPYYFIVIDDFKSVRELEIIKDICEEKGNIGFSIVIINNRLTNLPNECHTFISIGDAKSGIFENELVSNKQKEFIADYNPNIDMYKCTKMLANIPIETQKESGSLPSMISFLEMYDVGRVEQLNIQNRWKESNPTKTLQVPIGVDKNHELFKLDLHEKAHGPHGLIAGMTGSGKSELIITYILSLAVNYSPNEVSFILIDYKGGGLTGAFENKETGVKLPHLAGTITNLDTVEMNRSLASIQSELRRRQKKFNETRDALNESTIDIYKYQKLYREGLVKEPIPHLLIISDEFAELKDQQPEFMDELISTARIGRSLGVHLILATQKPAGVVNDQIWSNSKFRICLKVQDRSDSMDMIKMPDAASIKETGRFYLQVGYNELFALGQSAWTGAKYYPQDRHKQKIDERIDFVDNVGNVIKSLDSTNRQIKLVAEGEEITNIVRYVVEEAKKENLFARQLWLDKIPEFIYVSDLAKKYNYNIIENDINPIIGEFDDPNNQRQGLLTLPLSKDGNAVIYGSAGSGKELLLTTLIYSTITSHTPDEVNLYIMDFGAETLRVFNKAPQVGDVIFQNEREKVGNLFKLLTEELENRKKLFIDYNGDYDFYIKHSGNKLPTILVVINNYDAYSESYEEYDEVMQILTREGNKYGIIFVTTATSTNSLRYRIKQNFKQILTLQFNDPSDYSAVLGSVHKKVPSKIYGRGLINLEDTYEFQTAYPYKHEKMNEYLKTVSEKLNTLFDYRAKKIPVLPENITHELVKDTLNNLATIPIGVDKESLSIATMDFKNNYLSLITGNDVSNYQSFISNLIKSFSYVNGQKIIVLDALQLISENYQNTLIVNNDFNSVIEKLIEDLVNQIKVYQDNNYQNSILSDHEKRTVLILGVDSLLSKLDTDTKRNFTDCIAFASGLGTYNFVLIDSIERIKNIAFEDWIRNNLDTATALWLGDGIMDQFTIKLSSSPRELRDSLPQGFGIYVFKGKPYMIKLLEGEDE